MPCSGKLSQLRGVRLVVSRDRISSQGVVLVSLVCGARDFGSGLVLSRFCGMWGWYLPEWRAKFACMS